MLRTLRNGLLALASIFLVVAVVECGLRIRDYGSIARLSGGHVLRFPAPLRGWILLPGRTAFQRTRAYGVTASGNWEGSNILHLPRSLEQLAGELEEAPEVLSERLARCR